MITAIVWVTKSLGLVILFVALAVLLGFFYEQYLASKREPPRGQLVDIGGRALHLLCSGSGGPTVIWEAGGGSSSVASRQVQDAASEFVRICSYDRAGYGWSDPVNGPRTFGDIASDLERLIEAANLAPPYILVGESMGGLMVRQFAVRNPEKIAGVVLLDSAEEQHTFERERMLHRMKASAQVSRWLARIGLIRGIVSLFPDKLGIPAQLSGDYRRKLIDEISSERNFSAAIGELDAYFQVAGPMRNAGGFGELGGIPLVVVTHGRPFTGQQAFLEDGWADAQQRLATLSSRSSLVVAEDCGHAISLENPSLVADILRDLVKNARQTNPLAATLFHH